MSFNVRPWLRQRHDFWLSKQFALAIAGLEESRQHNCLKSANHVHNRLDL